MSEKNLKNKLRMGLLMVVLFSIILVFMFVPIFEGVKGKENGLNYMDSLYNSISKGSANYIPAYQKKVLDFSDKDVSLDLNFVIKNKVVTEQTVDIILQLLEKSEMRAEKVDNFKIKIEGSLGKIFENILHDSSSMFRNDNESVISRYSEVATGKEVLYGWWILLKAMKKSSEKDGLFEIGAFLDQINKKVVECTYNYYGIDAQDIGERWGIVVFSLAFYVLYTMWYGFAVMFVFEGIGFQLEEH